MISLIVPVLNEEEAIPFFYEALQPVLADGQYEFEIIFVEDGSADRTLAVIAGLNARDRRVKGIELSRNYGKELALAAGFRAASGDAVIPMDVDLQDPPELIPAFLQKWKEGYDVVLGVRRQRRADTWFKRFTAGCFYHFFNRICGKSLVPNAGDFRLMNRAAVDALNSLPERVRFTKGIYAWIGFKQAYVEYDRPIRVAGHSKWNTWKLWNFALDGITSFSTLPLRVWSYLGACVALVGFGYAAWLVLRTLIWGVDVPGYTSLMVVSLCLGGLILVSLGVVGEYLGRIFEEVKDRPLYIERSRLGFSTSPVRDEAKEVHS